MQGSGKKEGKEGEKDKDSDDNEDSVIVVDNSHTKDGSVYSLSYNNRHRLCYITWDYLHIYLVANMVNYPYYIRLGFKLMCLMENGKVKDWNKVKRNMREHAEMEGAITKSNKPLVLKLVLKEDNWSLASMCYRLVPSSS
eukprot:7623881-Ditylum_brightwellii.AAC.1